MLALLLTVSATLAATTDDTSGTGAAPTPEPAAESAPAPTHADAAPAPAAESAPATVPAATPSGTAEPVAAVSVPPAPGPSIGQRRAYTAGRIMANAGIVAMPVGVMTAAANLNIFGPGTPTEEFLFAGGALAAVSALPLAWTGTALERSAIRRAGCRPGGDGWRYAPLVPLAIGAVLAINDSEEIALGVAGAWAVVGVQHVVLQPSAKRCGLRGRP